MTDEPLTSLTDRCYKFAKTKDGIGNDSLHTYIGMLEGMLIVLSTMNPETKEYVRRELNQFLGES